MPLPSDDDDIELLEEMPLTAPSSRTRILSVEGNTGQKSPEIKRIDAEVSRPGPSTKPVPPAHSLVLALPDTGY